VPQLPICIGGKHVFFVDLVGYWLQVVAHEALRLLDKISNRRIHHAVRAQHTHNRKQV
jgi:hypothetical protein